QGDPAAVTAALNGMAFHPTAGFTGTATVGVIASDLQLSISSSIAIQVINRPPTVVTTASYTASMNTTLSVAAPGLVSFFADPDGDAVSINLVSGTSFGTLSVATNGAFVYIPNRTFVGHDSFVIQAYDGVAFSTSFVVSIDVQDPFNLRR